jgi:DNA-directed RNA polymerase specialized sigma24 family protein
MGGTGVNGGGDDLARCVGSPDPVAREQAWAVITDRLVDHAAARSRSPGHGERVNAQAVSVVQSVLRDVLDEPGHFENDDHLLGHLMLRVANKLRQRTDPRAGVNRVVPLDERFDAAYATDGAARAEGRAEVTRVMGRLRSALTESDWDLLRARAVDGLSWGQIAARLGVSEGTLRVRWHRLAPKARAALHGMEQSGDSV